MTRKKKNTLKTLYDFPLEDIKFELYEVRVLFGVEFVGTDTDFKNLNVRNLHRPEYGLINN